MDYADANRLIRSWFASALEAVDPAVAVARAVRGLPELMGGPPPVVLAIGKAAGAMTAGLIAALPNGIDRCTVITKDRRTVPPLPGSVDVFEASHPIPDDRSIAATVAALEMLRAVGPSSRVVVLISGGGSALFESPIDGVTLADIATLTRAMLNAGATINDLNAVRGRLSRVKQGGLTRFIKDAHPTTLVLSDVIGNDLGVIASGPTIPTAASTEEPNAILGRLGVWPSVPTVVRAALASAVERTTASAGQGVVRVIADNDTAVDAVARAAGPLIVDVVWRQRVGEARDLAVDWVDRCREASADVEVIVGGGEATVTVRGDGVGGRNTEFAVAAALELDRLHLDDWVVASLATDGDDGPTAAAGGIVTRRTVRAASDAGVDVGAALQANDTLRVLDVAGATVRSGPTGTNVNDLYVAVRVR